MCALVIMTILVGFLLVEAAVNDVFMIPVVCFFVISVRSAHVYLCFRKFSISPPVAPRNCSCLLPSRECHVPVSFHVRNESLRLSVVFM